jgi:uroporphyrinogen decarboxylase
VVITPFIPHLINIGLDVLEPVQPCMDISFLKCEYGKDLTFYGSIDTQDLLAFKGPKEIREETLRTIDILGNGGGYICAPAQEIMDNVPPENVAALVNAIREARGEK